MQTLLVHAAAAVARFLTFGGILISIGAVTFRAFVLHRVAAAPGADAWARDSNAAARAATIGRKAALLLLIGVLLRFAAQAADFRDPFEPLAPQLRLLIGSTVWGRAWIVQLLATLAALAAFALARRRTTAWTAAAIATLILAGTPAFSGHAVGSERLTTLAIAADTIHVLAAGAWLGTLLVLVAVAVKPAHPDTPARSLVSAFSPLALTCAATLIITGTFAGWLHVGTLGALAGTRYGITLLVKVGLVLLVVIAGAYNWRIATPRLREKDAEPLARSAWTELAIGTAVLLVTAILVATPLPGE